VQGLANKCGIMNDNLQIKSTELLVMYIVITSSEESLGNGCSVNPDLSIFPERTKFAQRKVNCQTKGQILFSLWLILSLKTPFFFFF